MVTKKKPFSDKQRIILDLLAERPKRWKDLKAITGMNPKTLKIDVLNELERCGCVRKLEKRRGYAITEQGMKELQKLNAIAYFRQEYANRLSFLMQQPSTIDSVELIRVSKTGKISVIYSPDIETETKLAELFDFYVGHGHTLSEEGLRKVKIFKASCRLFMHSFINSGGSQDYLDALNQAFSKWLTID